MEFDAKLSGLQKCLIPAIGIAGKPLVKDFQDANKVLLKVENDQLTVYATNGRNYVLSSLSDLTFEGADFKFHQDGEITVDVNDLSTVLGSFESDEMLKFSVDSTDNELKAIKISDQEEFQSIPILAQNLDVPKLPSKYVKEVTIDKEIFTNCTENVAFATGVETQQELFLYWIMRVAGNKKVRFIAGNKNRFAVSEVEHKDMVDANPSTTNVLFSKEHTSMILKTLASVDDKKIKVQQTDPKAKNYGLIVRTKPHILCMSNMEPNVAWPDENKILNCKFDHRIVTKVSDWKSANRGSQATFYDGAQDGKPHKTTLNFNFKQKNVKVTVNDVKKSARKVSISDAEYPSDDAIDTLNCVAPYLQEINKLGNKDGFVQIEFAKRRPILMRFTKFEKVTDAATAVNVRSHGYDEKTIMFFAPLSG